MSWKQDIDSPTQAGAATLADGDNVWVRLSQLVQNSRAGNELLRQAGSLLTGLLSGESYYLGLPSGDGRQLLLQSGGPLAPEDWESATQYDAETSLLSQALLDRRVLRVGDLADAAQPNDRVLQQRMVRAAVVAPLYFDEREFAALAICHSQPDRFSQHDCEILKAAVALLVPSLALEQAEKSLARQMHFVADTFDSMGSLVILLSASGHIIRCNRTCFEVTDFVEDDLKGRTLGSAMLVPDEAGRMHSALEQATNQPAPVLESCCILTKRGERRQIEWSLSALRGPDSSLQCLVASGIDVTDKLAAEERCKLAQQEVEATQASVRSLQAELTQRDANRVTEIAASSTASSVGTPFVPRERRRNPRRPFGTLQLVAPLIGNRLPQRSEFEEIRCRDISACGFSFYCEKIPDWDRVVVAFGRGSSQIYLIAEVVHASSVAVEGDAYQLVGCRYTGRAEY